MWGYVDVTVVSPNMGTEGWPFGDVDAYPGAQPDPLHQSKHVKDLYMLAEPNYDGRYAPPPPSFLSFR